MPKFITINQGLFQSEHIVYCGVVAGEFTVKKEKKYIWSVVVKFNIPQSYADGVKHTEMRYHVASQAVALQEVERIRQLLNGSEEEERPVSLAPDVASVHVIKNPEAWWNDHLVTLQRSIEDGTHPALAHIQTQLALQYTPTRDAQASIYFESTQITMHDLNLIKKQFENAGWFASVVRHKHNLVLTLAAKDYHFSDVNAMSTPVNMHKRQKTSCEPIEEAHQAAKES
jgi:hypothetical protein